MIKNMTPHEIRIRCWDIKDRAAEPRDTDIVLHSEGVARMESVYERSYDTCWPEDDYGGAGHQIVTHRIDFGSPVGLPEKDPAVHLIVSLPMLLALRGTRDDLLAPDTGDSCIRDVRGQVFAVTQLVR